MEAIIPYLTFPGNARAAFEFYAHALNGEISHLQTFGEVDPETAEADRNKMMHGILKSGALTIMASDIREQDDRPIAGNMISLSLNFTSEESINTTYQQLSEGAEIVMPLQDTFWNARFGILKDKFGIQWMFNYDKPQND